MKNQLYSAMTSQVSWLVTDNSPRNIMKDVNPFRPLLMWNNNRRIKNFLHPFIEQSILQISAPTKGPKTITDLAVKSYLTELQGGSQSSRLDANLIDQVIQNLKIFILAGQDTTASTLSFIYHLLHENPLALAAIRAEHDTVLSPDPSTAAAIITASPQLLNQLPYTSAVIKETLRRFPPVGTIRRGSSSFYITHPETGCRYPTDGFMVFGCSMAEHRLEAFWPRADEFLPERWLAHEGEALHVRKNAFRPFELGPRNCIGQELAQLEMKIILALTVREFDIQSTIPAGCPEVLGERVYQSLPPGQITGHPKDMMPVTVHLRG
jgi:hypothetical protein